MALFGELDLPNEKIEFLNNTFHCKAPKFDTYSKLRKYIYYDYDLLLLWIKMMQKRSYLSNLKIFYAIFQIFRFFKNCLSDIR